MHFHMNGLAQTRFARGKSQLFIHELLREPLIQAWNCTVLNGCAILLTKGISPLYLLLCLSHKIIKVALENYPHVNLKNWASLANKVTVSVSPKMLQLDL